MREITKEADRVLCAQVADRIGAPAKVICLGGNLIGVELRPWGAHECVLVTAHDAPLGPVVVGVYTVDDRSEPDVCETFGSLDAEITPADVDAAIAWTLAQKGA